MSHFLHSKCNWRNPPSYYIESTHGTFGGRKEAIGKRPEAALSAYEKENCYLPQVLSGLVNNFNGSLKIQ
jgi:hypothetical protein